jgi:hypothetical protein
MRLWSVALLGLSAVAVPLACGNDGHPPSLADPAEPDSGMAGRDGDPLMLDEDAGASPGGDCGQQVIPVVSAPPNLSFVIDHSGSMGDELAGSGLSKYENARIALSQVLKAIGHRVSYGAAIFPGLAGKTGCEPGDELMQVAPGDPPSYARAGQTGPRLKDLLARLSIASVDGGTPASATLDKMRGVLTELAGDTYVVLITDGAPNCNEELACEASGCIPNIEDRTVGGAECRGGYNCCDPDNGAQGAGLNCVDSEASLAAVQDLADAGIQTFVIGMPGSEPYEDLLNGMAELGGTAREGTPKYYSVADTEALKAALGKIAASVAISCEVPLDYDPPDPDYVNVFFDGVVVPYDPEQGWEWKEDGVVAVRGVACDQLMSGDVVELQVFAGCKTVVK